MKSLNLNSLVIVNQNETNSKERLKREFTNQQIINSAGTVFVVDNNNCFIGIITLGDYKRYLKSGELIINKNCKKVYEGENLFENLCDISKNYKNIHIVPVLTRNNNLIGAVRLRENYEGIKPDFAAFYEAYKIYPQATKQLFLDHNWETARIYGSDYVLISTLGEYLLSYNIVKEVLFVPYDKKDYWRIHKIYGDRLNTPEKVEQKQSCLELLTENYMLDNEKVSLSELPIMIEEKAMKMGETATCFKFDYKYELMCEIENKYGIHCKYISIPKSKDLMRNTHYIKIEEWMKHDSELYNEMLKWDVTYNHYMYIYSHEKSHRMNLVNGKRVVHRKGKNYKNTVYILGPCIVLGYYVDDDHTVGAYLQEKLENMSYKVEICAARADWGNYLKWLGRIKVKKGDYILFIDEDNTMPKRDLDMTVPFRKLFDDRGQFFFDEPRHCNEAAYECLANEIFHCFFEQFSGDMSDSIGNDACYIEEFRTKHELIYDGNKDLQKYKEKLKLLQADRQAGAIVMNCNSFTLGHRYLIEEALKQVEFLYIFVVEEDKSQFSFESRIKLVKEGVSDLKNVMVIPSGKFIISTDTFSEYFTKGMNENTAVDASLDVEIFAQHIAPTLGINIRFVGEEPFDLVTKAYNDCMLEILPEYGIEVVVIPRKEIEGEVISASRVRELLKNNDMKKIETFVPETTYAYLAGQSPSAREGIN